MICIHINILKVLNGVYKVRISNYMYSFFRFSQWVLEYEKCYINFSLNPLPVKLVIAMEFSIILAFY